MTRIAIEGKENKKGLLAYDPTMGKSSIMSISQKRLQDQDDKALIVNFNAWLFEGYDDIKTTIINYLLDSIEEKKKLGDKAKEILQGLRKSLLNINLIPVISKGFLLHYLHLVQIHLQVNQN